MKQQTKFQKNQVIWAKLKGYPAWPAIIAQILPTDDPANVGYVVNFLGEDSHCMLNNEKVFEFRSYYEEFMKPKEIKSKKLQDAIEMAL